MAECTWLPPSETAALPGREAGDPDDPGLSAAQQEFFDMFVVVGTAPGEKDTLTNFGRRTIKFADSETLDDAAIESALIETFGENGHTLVFIN